MKVVATQKRKWKLKMQVKGWHPHTYTQTQNAGTYAHKHESSESTRVHVRANWIAYALSNSAFEKYKTTHTITYIIYTHTHTRAKIVGQHTASGRFSHWTMVYYALFLCFFYAFFAITKRIVGNGSHMVCTDSFEGVFLRAFNCSALLWALCLIIWLFLHEYLNVCVFLLHMCDFNSLSPVVT